MTEPQHGDRPHSPGPSLYPIAFAAGIACILVGLIVNPKIIVPIGAVIAIVFGFLWARDATEEFRGEPVHAMEPESGGPDGYESGTWVCAPIRTRSAGEIGRASCRERV